MNPLDSTASTDPTALSHQLRNEESPRLARRRGIIGLTFLASACMELVGLFQTGVLRHLPEPPLPRLDADEVDASEEAYSMLRTPDGFLGLGSYSVTATLAAMGPEDRARSTPWVPLALAGKTVVDALQAARLTWDQHDKHRAYCFWCLTAAAATFATMPLALPEAVEAWRHLRDRRSGASSSPSCSSIVG